MTTFFYDEPDEMPAPTQAEQKAEAIERMKLIGIYEPIIKQFENDGLVSESVPPLGACYWIDEKQKKAVDDFQREFNGLVYHVVRTFYKELGEMWAFLYVSKYREEWKMDREDLSNGQILAYVHNVDNPEFSELGQIGFKVTPAAGLVRTW